MRVPPEIDLLPPRGGIEQGNHPPFLKKKNSKIISYLKNESQINVLLSKAKSKNGVNFLKNNQPGKFSLNQDKRREVTLYNYLSNLSYTQSSGKGINGKEGEIYIHRKYTTQSDNALMSSPPGKKKRTEKSTLLHRLVTLTPREETQKADAHLKSHAGEVNKNDIPPEENKIITHYYENCKMKTKKYSTLKYNIFVKGLKNEDNATEGRNTSFPREEPTIISNNVNSKKSQHAESKAKFNCDDLLQIYEHRYLRHILKNSKNLPSHREIKTINNADYVQGQNSYNSGDQQLSNKTKDNNVDKSEAGINHHHSRNYIHIPSDGMCEKNTVLKRNLNEEVTTPGDCTRSRYNSCHSNGANNANVKSNTADGAVSQVPIPLVKGINATALTKQNSHFPSTHIEDPHRSDNLGDEKTSHDGHSNSRKMGNSLGDNTEKENKNNPNCSNVCKSSYEDASQIELPQNGIPQKIETLSSANCARGESLAIPLKKPEQSGTSAVEKDNPTCPLPNTMQSKKEEGEKIPCAPNATEKLIKNILIKELKNEIYYSIIKMEEDEKVSREYEHRQSRKRRTYKLGSNNRFRTPRHGSHLFASCPPSFKPNTSSSDKNQTTDTKNIPETEVIDENPPKRDNKVEHKDKQKKVLKKEGNKKTLNGNNEETLNGSNEETLNGSNKETLNGSNKETLNGSNEKTLNGSNKETLNGSNKETLTGSNKKTLNGSKKKSENEEKKENKNCKVDINRAGKQINLSKSGATNGHVPKEEKRQPRDAPKSVTNVSTPKLVIHKIDKKNSKEYISIKIENKPSAVKKCTLEKTSKVAKPNREKKEVHSDKRGLPQSLPPEGPQKSTVKQSTDDRWSGSKRSSSTQGESKYAQNCAATPPPNCPPNSTPNSTPNGSNPAPTWTTWRARLFPLFRIEKNRIYADKNSRAYTTFTDHINDIICKIYRTQKRFLIFHIILYSVNLLIFYGLLQKDLLLNDESSSNTKGTMCILYILIAELYILFLNNAFYFFFKNQIRNAISSLDRVNLIYIMSKLFPHYSSFFKKQFSVHGKKSNSFCNELEGHQRGIHKEKALSSAEHFTNEWNNWSIKKKPSVRFVDPEILNKVKNYHHNVTNVENDHARYAHHSGQGSMGKNAPMDGENLVLLQNMRGALIHPFFNASNTTPYGTYSKQTQPPNSLTGQGNYHLPFEQAGQNDKVKYSAASEKAQTNKSTENEKITKLTQFILNAQKKNIPKQFFFFKLRKYFNLLIIMFAFVLIHTTIFLEIKDPFHFHVKTNLFFFIFVSFVILLQVLISIMAEIEEIFIQKMKMLLNKRVTFLDYQLAKCLRLKY
ncbi:Uncharacterized protein PCOAH_00037830 [Plasmodium coatneyi]|uniref:Uncharacterized protein n=1 Tax=Plasmodium coatneyi TaxID=208452 RepID=A0A1B1E3S4_9APIC|nr:Uncharacterized protein PCOAH_00037830 [Plasmodium coatneyi]ANQ09652.1 Uncharacterized protein PCOAH_00037830 [Plasmodium coatneyi]